MVQVRGNSPVLTAWRRAWGSEQFWAESKTDDGHDLGRHAGKQSRTNDIQFSFLKKRGILHSLTLWLNFR